MAQDTLLFGDGDCYKYQEYEGDAYETHQCANYCLHFTIDTGISKWLPDKNYWIVMQQYSDCDIIYGVSGLLGIGRIWFTNWDGGGIRTFSGEEREHISDFCEIYFVLGQKDSNGNFSIIDSVQWYPDSIDHYLQLRWNENVIAYYPVNDLYFENPHTFYGKNDTIGVGVYIKQKDGIIDYPIYKIGATIEFWLRCVQNEQDSVVWYSDPQRLVSRINNTYYYSIETSNSDSIPPKNHSGGFFPITCPKPEGPVEDTVGNGIARVRDLSEEVTVYPNPAREWVEVRSEGSEVLGVTVYDMRGQVVHKEEATRRHGRVDIRALPNGVYMMKVETEKGTAIKKVVKR
jgi:hypothetical protein